MENQQRGRNLTIRLVCLFLALAWGSMAQAQFVLTAGRSGAEWQIGTGLPLPIGPNGIFTGGQTTGDAGNWPDLLVPPNPNIQFGASPTRTIMQNQSTAQGGAIVVPASAFTKPANLEIVGAFNTNPAVYQIATSVTYGWPSATATFSPGGAPGPAILGTNGGGIINYSGGAKSFGGAGQFAFSPGPFRGINGGGSVAVPPNTLGVDPVASVWINAFAALPATAMTLALVGASAPGSLAQPGALVSSTTTTMTVGGLTNTNIHNGPVTSMFGPIATAGFRAVNLTGQIPVGPNGTVVSSLAVGGAGLTNMVTASKGFPWTTGFLTVSQPGAVPPEVFFLSGTDTRLAGQGNLQMVSGALSLRALSGPNANRAWVRMQLAVPEPSALLAVSGALLMLGACHTVVRRRRSN
jgi:hypothetical protein